MERSEAQQKYIEKLEAENRKLRSLVNDKPDVTHIAYLEAILNSLPDIVFLVDEKGTYLDILTDNESLLYKSSKYLLGKTFDEVLPKEIANKVNNAIKEVQQTKQPQNIEYQLLINNELKWFEARIAYIHNSGSERFVLLVMDISARKEITRLVETSKYKLQRAQEIARLAYFEWNLQTDKTTFSKEAGNLFYINDTKHLDMRSFFDFIDPKDRLAINKGLREEIFQKGSFVYEYEALINNKRRQHLIHCELIYEQENPVSIFGIIQDVTDIRKLESDHQKQSEEKNAMLHAIPDMMFIQNANGVFVDFHAPKGMEKSLLTTPDNFIGKKGAEVLPPDIATENIANIKHVLKTNQHVVHEYKLQINNKPSFYEARMVPSGNNQVLSIVREVSARKQAEQELIRAKMIAEESDRLKSAFLANMSHEIRTPMNGVIGFAELLLQENIPYDEKIEYFSIIEKNSHQLLQLIDDIIDVSKIEANMLELKQISFNVNDLLENLKKIYQKEADMAEKPLTLNFEGIEDHNKAYIAGDKTRLMQILQNLISNAVKFTETGEINIQTHISNDMLHFSVSDTGIGISEIAIKHIFERFRRLENPADKVYRGTGLGLAVTKGLIELMGGSISVKSREGEGSTFYFSIPYVKGDIPNKKTPYYQEWQNFKNHSVLIVEDEDTSYHYLASILKKNEVIVHRAHNGYQAIEQVKNTHIDLILMDIQLPELNGYDATRYIKKLNPNIPVIAQTAFAMTEDEQKALDAGCDDYVAKPISSFTLLDKMKAFLV